jgi:hypothetical protein
LREGTDLGFFKWLQENYGYLIAAFMAVIFVVKPSLLYRLLKIFKKLGPVELFDQRIDPNTPCPYTKSRDVTFDALRDINENITGLDKETKEIISIVKDLTIDHYKGKFYDKDQPDMDRMYGGLKYIYYGGNDDTKEKVVMYAGEKEEIYKTTIYHHPELRLAK